MTETAPDDLALPEPLEKVLSAGCTWEWDDQDDSATGCDFDLYDSIEHPERTAWWFCRWTGNPETDGSEFRFFGTTGAGDYTGFWLVRPGVPLAGQPVVYLGSEGQRAVVARDLGDLLWLFAAGYGPAEAVGDRDECTPVPSDGLRAIAARYAPGRERPAEQIVAEAQAEFPHLSDYLDDMCR